MRQNGRIRRKKKEILNYRRNMKKNKMRHYETLKRDLFPQVFPQAQNSGETKSAKIVDKPQQGHVIGPNIRHSTKYGNGLGILMNTDASRCR